MVRVDFAYGTLEIRDVPDPEILPEACRWDARTACHRAPAVAYADVIMSLVRRRLPYEDAARAYEVLELKLGLDQEPRPYQIEALDAWRRSRGRGVVVLPTGAGKTWVALMALADKQRSTLVVAPTLDLVRQWYDGLRKAFGCEIGVVGGGEHDLQPITVTTYDSAYLHMEHFGARFGLVIFDECHHLPGDAYGLSARFCLAPYRLGLTATPERADGREVELAELIGPPVYHQGITALSGDYLAEYQTETVLVALSVEERTEYESERAIYREFVQRCGIRMSTPHGWSDFVIMSSRSVDGRRAMHAYRRQRSLAYAAPSKLDYIETLLYRHRGDRSILFTQDNATAHAVARRFLVPVITHQTKITERSAILGGLVSGSYTAVVTSKVLNEGVDVPEANVAVVISGSGSVREHVQRLGRVLRKREGKRAVLYELVSEETSEAFTSQRRREHDAYR